MRIRGFTNKRLAALLVVATMGTAAGTAYAVTSHASKTAVFNFSGPFKSKASVFNPGGLPMTLSSDWTQGAGQQGSGDPGWVAILNMTAPASPGGSADNTITPVLVPKTTTPIQVGSLGFDHLLGTHCTNGAPRWDVELVNGGVYGIGCAAGSHVPNGTGWERITFGDADVQHLSGPAWPNCFTTSSTDCGLSFLQVTDDEGPEGGVSPVAVLDNFQINGYYIRKG